MSGNKPVEISDHEVRVRAYRIWEKSGKPEGRADEHWREALKELEAEYRAAQAGHIAQVPSRPRVSSRPARIVARAISKVSRP